MKTLWPFSFFRQRRLNRALLDAVGQGDVETARALLDAGADVNSSDGFRSALAYAGRSHLSNAATVSLLLERGASLGGVPKNGGIPPLFAASHFSDEPRVRLLIEAGCDVNVTHPASPGFTPLAELVNWADLETINFMIDRGADVNKKGLEKEARALHVAAAIGRPDVVGLL